MNNNLVYSFDEKTLKFTGVASRSMDPVRGTPAGINPACATLDPVPLFNPKTQEVYREGDKWVVVDITYDAEAVKRKAGLVRLGIILAIAAKKSAILQSGIRVGDHLVSCTASELSHLTMLRDSMKENSIATIRYKTLSEWVVVDMNMITMFIRAIGKLQIKLLNKQYHHEATVNSIEDLDVLSNYDIHVNW